MSRINLTGTIVPSYYDIEFMQDYIKKGVIIPESAFKRLLDEASVDEPLEIYVNSPGGSVFSGYEMKNIVTRWQMDTKQKVTVTVGAMAASAASTFIVALGAPTRAHKNAKFMFHGATSATWGGKEAHEDEADLLGKINAEIMQRLTGKYGISPEQVQEWFSESRKGWLTAEEAKGYGIVSEIVEESADAIQFADVDIEQLGQNGLAVAALMDVAEEPQEDEPDTPDGEEPDNQPNEEPDDDEIPPLSNEEQETAIEQIKAEAVAEATEPLNLTIAKLEKALEKLNAALDKKQQTIDKMNSDLIEANQRLSKVSPNRSTASEAGGADGEIDWKDALSKCGGDYVKTRKQYPKTFARYVQQANQ